MAPIQLSVVIITFNEAGHIRQCLESVRSVADEVIVLDSYSTDDTVMLAEQAGARVYRQAFKGYGVQKNDANRLAAHTWVLSLDADEVLTPELAAEIQAFKNTVPPADAYAIPRLNNYLGKWLRHGGWYPDAKIRLFNRTPQHRPGQAGLPIICCTIPWPLSGSNCKRSRPIPSCRPCMRWHRTKA